MKLTVEPEVLALFPAALIGVIVVRGCDNAGALPEVEQALRRAEAAARAAFGGNAGDGGGSGGGGGAGALGEEPRIACWREAYRRFGGSPKKNPSSIESLLRRVLKGEKLRPINSLVDLYNAVSLERILPAGGEDLGAVRGDVALCRAGESEPPVRLLGDAEARPPHAGEVIYRDDLSALCRRWNWKEAERTKLTAATRDALLVVEALPPSGRGDLEAALEDLAARVSRHCGGAVHTAVLDAARPAMTLFE
jgi:DNA/RNA-binding domain of Phe-tRNA-synthetase-like protein